MLPNVLSVAMFYLWLVVLVLVVAVVLLLFGSEIRLHMMWLINSSCKHVCGHFTQIVFFFCRSRVSVEKCYF